MSYTDNHRLAEVAEEVVFRWYSKNPGAHDLLDQEGLDDLLDAIAEVAAEKGLAADGGQS